MEPIVQSLVFSSRWPKMQSMAWLKHQSRNRWPYTYWPRTFATSDRHTQVLENRNFHVTKFYHSQNSVEEICLPNMYIRVKQLSNANPAKYRQTVNDQKLLANAVTMPAVFGGIMLNLEGGKNCWNFIPVPPTTLAATRAGTRPKRSAIQPNERPPVIAPTKNSDYTE